jgi:hypothetical protein
MDSSSIGKVPSQQIGTQGSSKDSLHLKPVSRIQERVKVFFTKNAKYHFSNIKRILGIAIMILHYTVPQPCP